MTPTKATATQIMQQMFENDAFSQWLGITILNLNEGTCTLEMTTRPEMLNGFGILHGGITYSLADSALAFASNSQGKKAVSIETSIAHMAAVQVGDVLTATAKEENLTHKIATYTITVTNQADKKVALFKGTVYRSSKEWLTA